MDQLVHAMLPTLCWVGCTGLVAGFPVQQLIERAAGGGYVLHTHHTRCAVCGYVHDMH